MSVSGINLSIVAGALSRPPEARTLPSGDRLLVLHVTVRSDSGPTESVPVAWFEPPATAGAWEAGDEVVVVGRVRRRFFRAGGATASRTEVVADTVVPARQRARARKVVGAAVAAAVPQWEP
jgi:single-strand DNA-binding protein